MQRGMLKRLLIVVLFAVVAACLAAGNGQAAGLLSPADGSLPALKIKEHLVQVVIEDGYAITTVEQVFHNPHARDLEALYSFPLPERGAVSEFTMWIDGNPVHGEVLEKKRAREVYEAERAQGREAGITEKESYRTFDITVSPVRAGQDTRIRLAYMQPVQVDTGIGRYVYPLEEGGVDEEKLQFWTANEQVDEVFSFDLSLRSDYPVDSVRLPRHPHARIAREGESIHVFLGGAPSKDQDPPTAEISLETAISGESTAESADNVSANQTLDRDIVVYWRLADNLPGSVDLVTYKPEAEQRGTFMLTVTPGMDLKPITEGKDWVFVLDISGSMQGKFHTLVDGVGKALGKLATGDRFRIIAFNDRAGELTSGFTQATTENVNLFLERLAGITPGSGTNVYDGLQMGLGKLEGDRTSAILLVTDGVANVGVTEQKKFIDLVRSRDVRLFTFIMGNSANLPLLEGITRASGGFSMTVSNSDDIVGSILLAQSKVTHQALHGAKLRITGVNAFDLTPESIGSLYRGQQLVVFGHYAAGGEAEISLTGRISGEEQRYRARFPFPETSSANPELERLWAYATIERLTREMADFGEDADARTAVTDLGVEYGLVTDYTSMVVVRDEVFEQLGIDRRNRDRLGIEEAARQHRAKSGVASNRVDAAQPMFNGNRPTTRSGGAGAGSAGPWFLLAILPFAWLGRKTRIRSR